MKTPTQGRLFFLIISVFLCEPLCIVLMAQVVHQINLPKFRLYYTNHNQINMKQLLFLFLITFSITNAQTPRVRKGLTDAELQTTKALYVKMSESETAKLRDEAIKKQVQLSNGVMMPHRNVKDYKPDEPKGEEGIRKRYTEFWTLNIARSKFITVDEAVDAHMEPFKLQMKLREENPELYKYMDNATIGQLSEIKQIDIDAARKRVYDRFEERNRRPE